MGVVGEIIDHDDFALVPKSRRRTLRKGFREFGVREPAPALQIRHDAHSLDVAASFGDQPMKTAIATALSLLIAACATRTQASEITEAPQFIQELASAVQGLRRDDAHAEIIKRLGPARRHVGSGIRREEWDLPGGTLTFHPGIGPTFDEQATGKCFWLMHTANRTGDCLLDSYEMSTLPNRKNDGVYYWIGNVKFGVGNSYHFTDGGQNLDHRTEQKTNFFMLHPRGTVAVHYTPPITPDTLLESLPESQVIAHLVFTSADRKHKATFFITSSENGRSLTFGADKPLSFSMDCSWRNFWNDQE